MSPNSSRLNLVNQGNRVIDEILSSGFRGWFLEPVFLLSLSFHRSGHELITLQRLQRNEGCDTALSLKVCSTIDKDNCRYFIDNCRCKTVTGVLLSESVADRSEKVTQSEEQIRRKQCVGRWDR